MIVVSLALLLSSSIPSPRSVPQDRVAVEPVASQGAPTLAIYEIGDLQAFRALSPDDRSEAARVVDSITATDAERSSAREAATAAELARQHASEALARILPHWIQPAFDEREHQIRAVGGGTLAVLGSPEQHAWLQRFFARHRESARLLDLQVVCIEGPEGAFSTLGIAGGASATALADAQRDRVLALAKDDPRYKRVTSPRIIAFPLGTAHISVGDSIAYVKSYKQELVEPGPTAIVDPEVAHVFEGWEFEMIGALVGERRLGLEVELVTSSVQRPIPTRSVRLAEDSAQWVEIAEPEVTRISVKTRCELESGSTVAFSLPSNEPARELVVLMQARLVEPEPELVPDAPVRRER